MKWLSGVISPKTDLTYICNFSSIIILQLLSSFSHCMSIFLLQISCIFYSYFFFISFSFLSRPPDTFDSKWLFFFVLLKHSSNYIFRIYLFFPIRAQNDFWETRKRIFYESWPVLSIVLYSIWPSMILITFHMHLQMRVKIYMLILLGNYFSFFLSSFFALKHI